MKITAFFTMITAVSLFTLSGGVYAKQDNNGSESSEINTNRQTQTEESVRGTERATERQELKETREPGSESSEINTNRQTQTEENVRGTDRAGERHELKSTTTTTKSQKKTRVRKSRSPRQQ
ncbi:MAG: hypothetical protein ACR65R_00610 [Methylomicrobium sp.]